MLRLRAGQAAGRRNWVIIGALAAALLVGVFFIGRCSQRQMSAPAPQPTTARLTQTPAKTTDDLAILGVTPRVVKKSALEAGSVVVLHFQGFGFNKGLIIHCYDKPVHPTVAIDLLPAVFLEEPDNLSLTPVTSRTAKAVLPADWPLGSWTVQPELNGKFGALLPEAFSVIGDVKIAITAVTVNTKDNNLPANYKAEQIVIRVTGSGFNPNTDVFVKGLKVREECVRSQPNLVTITDLKFESGQRLTGGIHEFKMVNPDRSEAKTTLTVGPVVESQRLPKKGPAGKQVAVKILLFIILLAACLVFCIWFAPAFAGSRDPSTTVQFAADGATSWLCWSTRIAIIGFFGFLLFLFVYPNPWLLEFCGFVLVLGIVFMLFALRGQDFAGTLGSLVRNPIILIGLLLFFIILILQLAGWLN